MKNTMNSFRIGDLVFTKDVGFPFNRTDDGQDSWEGCSCVVTALNMGWDKRLVEVEPLFPVKAECGCLMTSCVFRPEQLVKENRPWLKKNIKRILSFRKEVEKMGRICEELNA